MIGGNSLFKTKRVQQPNWSRCAGMCKRPWPIAGSVDFQSRTRSLITLRSRAPAMSGSVTVTFSAVSSSIAAGLVGGEGFAVDASLIVADANKQRSFPGAEWNKERAAKMQAAR
jgi:hypothetical protein